jgi:hypothetical protein
MSESLPEPEAVHFAKMKCPNASSRRPTLLSTQNADLVGLDHGRQAPIDDDLLAIYTTRILGREKRDDASDLLGLSGRNEGTRKFGEHPRIQIFRHTVVSVLFIHPDGLWPVSSAAKSH